MSFYSNRNKGIRYLGGKGKCGEIVGIINGFLPPGGVFWDAFCGSCKIVQHVRAAVRYASDIDPYIMCLLKAVQSGWEPPSEVTEAQYRRLMKLAKKGRISPLIAFTGYACSFGARWFQGYARNKGEWEVNFADSSRRSIVRQKPFLEGVKFLPGDYREVRLGHGPDVIYCDPPYAGTKPVGCLAHKFDNAAFWKWARKKARNSVVLVSEYACPLPEAVVLWQKSVAAGLRYGTGGDGGAKGSGKRKVEKLFCLDQGLSKRVGLGLF